MAINKDRYNCKAELNDIFAINIDDWLYNYVLWYYCNLILL
jgi:hypothetical protein